MGDPVIVVVIFGVGSDVLSPRVDVAACHLRIRYHF
jgi:hypothetical protein